MIWRTPCSLAHVLVSEMNIRRLLGKTFGIFTIVPNVISPTSAYGGSKLRLIISDSLRDFKLSTS